MERLTKNVDGCNQIIDCGNDLCKETCEEWSCEFCPISKAIDKLADYEEAEEQGLLLRLPCKVGDKVYVKLFSYYESKYAEAEVVDFTHFISCGFCIVVTSKHFDKQAIPFSELGKTVFPTKEEAEQALKRMESE